MSPVQQKNLISGKPVTSRCRTTKSLASLGRLSQIIIDTFFLSLSSLPGALIYSLENIVVVLINLQGWMKVTKKYSLLKYEVPSIKNANLSIKYE